MKGLILLLRKQGSVVSSRQGKGTLLRGISMLNQEHPGSLKALLGLLCRAR